MVKKLDTSLRPVWYEGDSDYILAPAVITARASD